MLRTKTNWRAVQLQSWTTILEDVRDPLALPIGGSKRVGKITLVFMLVLRLLFFSETVMRGVSMTHAGTYRPVIIVYSIGPAA